MPAVNMYRSSGSSRSARSSAARGANLQQQTVNLCSRCQWTWVPYIIIIFLSVSNFWMITLFANMHFEQQDHNLSSSNTVSDKPPKQECPKCPDKVNVVTPSLQVPSGRLDTSLHNKPISDISDISSNSYNTDTSYSSDTSYKNKNKNKKVSNTKDENKCHFDESLENSIYVYDLPYEMRDGPRKSWYEMFYRRKDYDSKISLNFGFGDIMEIPLSEGSVINNSENEYYYTHMHSLEIIFNERMTRQKNKYITDDPEKAKLFWIPFPFALHFRFWHGRSWDDLITHHNELQDWLNKNEVYNKYIGQKPHFINYGRISYETGQIRRHGSKFWVENRYWVLSIDRNCHGDPDSCWKRVSMPHPSVYHPNTISSLHHRIQKSITNKRDVLVSFCGAVRTPTRQQALDVCTKTKKHPKWQTMFDGSLCEFEDSLAIEQEMKKTIGSQGERRRRIELLFSKQCTELYERSVFCIQQGADSTTRKGLWDGIVAGCIPVFLNGVMDNEFDCYGNSNMPWYVVLNQDYYVKQLLSMSADHIELLQRNLRRMVPKIIYTNGEAGFSDAIDVIVACLMRKAAIENAIDNPQCTPNELVKHDWYDMDEMLGYDELYPMLGID